jgi:hypothetical protein
VDAPLYQSLRVGLSACAYVVPNGAYDVTLKFAELSYGTVGQRRADVFVEGQQVLDDLDIFARVGKNAALDCTFAVAVTDGSLNISFVRVSDNPSIGAIQIVPSTGTAAGCGAVAATATPSAVASQTATLTRTPTPTATATPSSTPLSALSTLTASPTPPNPLTATATNAATATATRTLTPLQATVVLASDTFECGTEWGCGTGWVGPWEPGASASIVTGGAHSGSRSALLRAGTGAERWVALNGAANVRWQLWVKINSFEAADTAVAQVLTDDGEVLATVQTWTRADSTNSYRFYDIDLSAYASFPQILLRLRANGNALDDYFSFDDVQVIAS